MKRFKHWLGRLLLGDELIDAVRLSAEARQTIYRLELRPGDIVVLQTELSLSQGMHARLKKDAELYLEKILKREQPVIVLGDGIGIKILSTQPARASSPAPPPPLPDDIPFRKS